MTTFNDREKAFEKAYAQDAEVRFQVHSRGAKMLARWAAEQAGLSANEANDYVRQALAYDMKKEGISDLEDYLHQDLARRGKTVSLNEIKAKTQDFLKKAKADVMGEKSS